MNERLALVGLARSLLSKLEGGATLSQLLESPEAQQLVQGVKQKQEATPEPVFSCCPNCGLRYETTISK